MDLNNVIYVKKYLMCVLTKYLVIVTKRSSLSYYSIHEALIIRRFLVSQTCHIKEVGLYYKRKDHNT